MRTENFRRTLYAVAHLLGIDPYADLNKDQARGFASSFNSHARYGWEMWDWPEVNIIEERAFRQNYNSTLNYLAGTEVYSVPLAKYYVRLGPGPDIDVPSPPDPAPPDATTWAEVTLTDKYVAFDQVGKQAIGRVHEVFDTSPRTTAIVQHRIFRLSEYGIDVTWASGQTVWLRYQIRPSVFTTGEYSSTANYVRGDLAYDPVLGNCYRALAPSIGEALTDPVFFILQPLPYFLSEYVKYQTAADFAEDQTQAAVWRDEGKHLLQREVDKQIEQGRVNYYDTRGASQSGFTLGLSGFRWSVSPPYAVP